MKLTYNTKLIKKALKSAELVPAKTKKKNKKKKAKKNG